MTIEHQTHQKSSSRFEENDTITPRFSYVDEDFQVFENTMKRHP